MSSFQNSLLSVRAKAQCVETDIGECQHLLSPRAFSEKLSHLTIPKCYTPVRPEPHGTIFLK